MKNLLLILLCFPLLVFSQDEKRVALVIGNSAYPSHPLDNAVNDAKLIDSTLQQVGFDVTRLDNLKTNEDFFNAMFDFSRKLDDSDVGFIYYAGHGIEIGTSNYLIPTGVNFTKYKDFDKQEAYIKNQSFLIQEMMGYLKTQKKKLNIVVLDACRVPVQARGNSKKPSINKSSITVNSGTLLAFATRSGEPAEDGVGNNSTYCESLCKQILVANQSLGEIFGNVRDDVEKNTSGRQSPIERSAISAHSAKNFSFITKENTKVISLEDKLKNAFIQLYEYEDYLKTVDMQVLNIDDPKNIGSLKLMEFFNSTAIYAKENEKDIHLLSLLGLMKIGNAASYEISGEDDIEESTYALTLCAEATINLYKIIRDSKKEEIVKLLEENAYVNLTYEDLSYRVKIAYLLYIYSTQGGSNSFVYDDLYEIINALNCNKQSLNNGQLLVYNHLLSVYVSAGYLDLNELQCLNDSYGALKKVFTDFVNNDTEDPTESLQASSVPFFSSQLREYYEDFKQQGFATMEEYNTSYGLYFISYHRALVNHFLNYIGVASIAIEPNSSFKLNESLLEEFTNDVNILTEITLSISEHYWDDFSEACENNRAFDVELFEELFSYTCYLNIQLGMLKENDNNEQINTIKVARELLNHYDKLINEWTTNSVYHEYTETDRKEVISYYNNLRDDPYTGMFYAANKLDSSKVNFDLNALKKECRNYLDNYWARTVENNYRADTLDSEDVLIDFYYYKALCCNEDYASTGEAEEKIQCFNNLSIAMSANNFSSEYDNFVMIDLWNFYKNATDAIICDSEDENILNSCRINKALYKIDYFQQYADYYTRVFESHGNGYSFQSLENLLYTQLNEFSTHEEFELKFNLSFSDYTNSFIVLTKLREKLGSDYLDYSKDAIESYFSLIVTTLNSNNLDINSKKIIVKSNLMLIERFLNEYAFSREFKHMPKLIENKIVVSEEIMEKAISDVKTYGEVKKAFIGIRMENIENGVLIIEVIEGGAAEKTGLKENDVLLSINDIKLDSYHSVIEQISKYNPGDTVRLEIKRRNKKQIFNLELQ